MHCAMLFPALGISPLPQCASPSRTHSWLTALCFGQDAAIYLIPLAILQWPPYVPHLLCPLSTEGHLVHDRRFEQAAVLYFRSAGTLPPASQDASLMNPNAPSAPVSSSLLPRRAPLEL